MKIKAYLILAFLFFGLHNLQAQRSVENSCNRDDAKEKCRKAITPYRYANMVVSDITFRRFNQVKEVTIPLYYDSKYRFVFNTEGLPQNIKIEIYDRHSTDKKRSRLAEFSSTEGTFTYEPEENKFENIYVNYLIPADNSEDLKTIRKGCVVMMGGFENILNFDMEGTSSTSGE